MKRIAIVNRGDAAVRCIRAIRELRAEEGSDLLAIALYTDPERGAPFVRLADEAISLGPALRAVRGAPARPVYLDRARVLAALRATRADAVWPGWGFLAEDPAFVEALESRGITFLGPSSTTIRALGDKIAAKLIAERVGVSVVPWSGKEVTAETVASAAEKIGYPLLLKASAGGGGRGIRVVDSPNTLVAAFASAVHEAEHAFGDGRIFAEALIRGGRHIEVQIAADRHGHCVALGLRDCSIQRRHQKIIEEAPPPHLAPKLARRLRDASVRMAKEAGYCGVGTVEFLLAPDGREFYFLEINPRLQVEHGLTEELTGIDLVKLQIRIARGEVLPEVEPPERGHAIEARVCAEDPDQAFMPAPGRVIRMDLPSGAGIRVDCGIGLDSNIPPEFDPLIAKVIAHGPTREAAIARLRCALAEFRLVIAGGASNKGFLLGLLESEPFRAGGVDVAWLDQREAEQAPPYAVQALMVASILSYLRERATARLNFLAEAASGMPRTIPPSNGQVFDLSYRGQAYRVTVLGLGNWSYRIHFDDRECVATLLDQEENACQLMIGNDRFMITYAINPTSFRIEVNGRPHVIGCETGGKVRASAPSVVIAVDVRAGDSVATGQRLGLLETMKIEIAFTTPVSGVVKEVLVRPGQRVAAGDVLVVIQAEPSRESAETHAASRLRLPDWTDPLQPLIAPDGTADWAGLATRTVPVRERALRAIVEKSRRLLLGYDVTPDHDGRLLRILQTPLPEDLDHAVLEEIASLHEMVVLFAETQSLFSRAPEIAADGTLGPSNDSRLRTYLRRIGIQGAGISPVFLDRLRAALRFYDLHDLAPCVALERALLRMYAASANSEPRYRLVTGILRFLIRLAERGIDLSSNQRLNRALTTCTMLRGEVPDTLADAAADAHYAIFELPRIRAQAAVAAAAVESALQTAGDAPAGSISLDTLGRLADSPAQIFDRIAQWTAEGNQARRDIALQALVLRRYAPLVPLSCAVSEIDGVRISRLAFPDQRVVLACVTPDGELEIGWNAIARAAGEEKHGPLLELMMPVHAAVSAETLRGMIAPLLERDQPMARRICLTALEPDGSRAHVVYQRMDPDSPFQERCDLFGLHPETARRIEVDRLCNFELERLPAPESVYAFFGRSRAIPDDERIFVLAEARAAAPGARGTLHEPAFVQTFYQAIHTLRNIRVERDQRRRLHWNRITIFVRPPLVLIPERLNRLVRQLSPAARHLGLEKIVVRLALLERDRGGSRPAEVVIEINAGGRPEVIWREPHRAPLQPATRAERLIAQARRRGLAHPAEVIRLFSGISDSNGAGQRMGQFQEYDLDPGKKVPVAVPVEKRPLIEHRCGVLFGVISTPTAKYPEGMRRVLIASDPTSDMGALAAPECDRIVAAIDLAERERIPVEWVAISAGARIAMDSGTENLDATARVVRRIVTFTQAGGEINLIVAGVNVGAQSYFNALATMMMHTRGVLIMTPQGAMVLTGRRALEASGGVSAEDEIGIGGYERIMGPSGQAQYYARDLHQAYEILLEHYRFTYVKSGESAPRRAQTTDAKERAFTLSPYPAQNEEGFKRVGEIFDDETNPGRKRPFAMRPVMQALIDQDGGFLERWPNWTGAETAIVWDAQIGGFPVCLIGIESRSVQRLGYRPQDGPDSWTGGTLFPLSSRKVARAINAASANRPVVVLANLSGFDGSPESMRKLQLEFGAEIARAVVNFKGPILFVVVSRYHGGAYVVFSRALNDDLWAIALEGSHASVIGGGPAATVVFAREVQARTDSDPRVVELREKIRSESEAAVAVRLRERLEQLTAEVALEKHGEIAREFDQIHSVERALRVGSLDRILPASALRPAVIDYLEACYAAPKRPARRPRKAQRPGDRP